MTILPAPGPRHLAPCILLLALHAVILMAPWFAPYDPTEQNRGQPYAAPSLIPVMEEGRTRIFVFGTDAYGRDQLSRLLYGGRLSLAAGLLAAGISLVIGVAVGAIAGYRGGWVDDVLMRGAELFLALPWLYLLFAVRAFLPLGLGPGRAFLLVVAVIGVVGWARPARLVRGVVLSARERGYVIAAKAFGASGWYLLRRHILPQTAGLVLTQATLLVPRYILAEVTLSFLGLGVGEPTPSLGNMLADLQHYSVVVSHWWILLPGVALVPVILGYFVLTTRLLPDRKSGTL